MHIRAKRWARPELAACPYFISEIFQAKGGWRKLFAAPENPLHLDLGCGKGWATCDLAKANPDINYIALDQKSDILGVCRRYAQTIFDGEPKNLLITAYDATRLKNIFDSRDAIERIYIGFPTPYYKPRLHKHRLIHTRQLAPCREILSENGEIWFKTDHREMFESALDEYFPEAGFEVTFSTRDLRNHNTAPAPGNISPAHSPIVPEYMSEHEKKFAGEGKPIYMIIGRKR